MSTIKTNAIQTVAGKPILNSTGSILQVVQTVDNVVSTTTSGTFNDLQQPVLHIRMFIQLALPQVVQIAKFLLTLML
jgi:hypothetical protein